MKPHRWQRHPVLLNMMADLAGPYPEGEDVEVQKGKYVLLVVYPFPLWIKKEPPANVPIPEDICLSQVGEEDPMGDADSLDPFPPEVDADTIGDPPPKERELADKDTAAWASMVDTLKGTYKVVNLCFSEVLPNKRPTTVTSGLSRVYARLRSFGFPIYGLYTDRGGEMVNSAVRVWSEARSLLRRTSAPESHASNGRDERMLALIRRDARALLASARVPPRMWPHAIRHATEQRLRRGLAALAHPIKPMVPFWAKVTIRARTWNDKKWSTRALTGQVVAPSAEVEGGWIVRVAGDKVHFHVSTLLYLGVRPALDPPDLSQAIPEDEVHTTYPEPVPRHRAKSPVELLRVPDEEEEAIPKVPTSALAGMSPVRRHLSQQTSGLPPGTRGAVGSAPVPGSFLEDLAGRPASSSAGPVLVKSVIAEDKTIIVEHGPRLCKVVGSNPQFHEFAPAAGYYQLTRRVRYRRLQPHQWEVIQRMGPTEVPGLGVHGLTYLWICRSYWQSILPS